MYEVFVMTLTSENPQVYLPTGALPSHGMKVTLSYLFDITDHVRAALNATEL